MLYAIPDSKLEKLEKQCNHIRNKGANVIFDIKEPTDIKAVNDPKVAVPGHFVEVDGSYKINGWEFVATIEHTPAGNIIRCINSSLESKIPEKYKNCGLECEHCNRIRNRKDTYLIYNSEKDEFKQVGKSCLREYTGGLDAAVCADIAAFFAICEDADYFEEEGPFRVNFGSPLAYDANEFKKYAYSVVKQDGYKKDVTIDTIFDAIRGKAEKEYEAASDEDIQKVNEYADSIDAEDFGYFRNAKLAWAKKYIESRDMPLIASFISTYFKNLNKQAQLKAKAEGSEWVGEVGEKISIEIASYRVLFENHYEVAWHTYANSYTYEIVDTKGNIFIWKSSKNIEVLEETDATGDVNIIHIKPLELTGKVKDHTEYKGVKQTVMGRCKVTDYKNLYEDNSQSRTDALHTLNSFIDDLEN